jgi:flagellar biosynthesis GTPase FlhF
MFIKTYRAESIHDALQIIREDLGPDALVLKTRQVRAGSLFGLFGGRRCWELKASAEGPVLGPWVQSVERLDRGIELDDLDASMSPHERD